MKRGVPYKREVDEQIEVMGRLGVPASAIVVMDEANSTADEATALREIATRQRSGSA